MIVPVPPRLKQDEPSVKVDVMMPKSLKEASERAAKDAGLDTLSAWIRWLMRREVSHKSSKSKG